MLQELFTLALLISGAGLTLWSFYDKFTAESAECGGGCTCKSPEVHAQSVGG